jgi:hypothetical protein
MEPATTTKKHDIRRSLSCAALAGVTTLGMFSLIANFMTPLLAGIQLLPDAVSAQEMRVGYRPIEDTACVEPARDEAIEPQKPSTI